MQFTATAKAVYERGVDAFRSMTVRPDPGHTRIALIAGETNFLKFGCLVGVLAYEAATLQGYSDAQARRETTDDDNAKRWVMKVFGVTEDEAVDLERGFDAYFEARHSGTIRIMEHRDLPLSPEMIQVGWHVAKRATREWRALDKAEDEAWEHYHRENLKDYTPHKPVYFRVTEAMRERSAAKLRQPPSQAEIDALIEKFIEECGEDCEEREVALIG